MRLALLGLMTQLVVGCALAPGRISGTVVNGEGRPVAYVSIHARLVGSASAARDWEQLVAYSDPAGAFALEAPAIVGDERLVLTAGLLDGWCIARRELRVAPGRRDDVVLVFEGTRSIAGTVLDEAGVPLQHATVQLYPVESSRHRPLSAHTDEGGRFEFPVVPAERLRVVVDYRAAFDSPYGRRASSPAVRLEDRAVVPVDCRQESERQWVFRRGPMEGRLVRGVLSDAAGPVAARELLFLRESTDQLGLRLAQTDATGAFEALLAEGAYSVLAERPSSGEASESVVLGQVTVPPPNGRLQLRIPGGAISGHVIGAHGAHGAGIELLAVRSEGALADEPPLEVGRRATTDSQGHFTFAELEPGRWSIASVEFGEVAECVSGFEVDLDADEQREGLRLECVATVPLTVEVVGGQPDWRPTLFLRRADGDLLAPFGSELYVNAENVGSVRLPAGRVQVMALQGDLASDWSPVLDLQPGASRSIELHLRAAGSVRVLCQHGGLEAPATLRLYDARGDVSAVRSTAFAAHLAAPRGAHRRRFGPLPPGAYQVVAEAEDGQSVERSFALAAGEVLELTLEL